MPPAALSRALRGAPIAARDRRLRQRRPVVAAAAPIDKPYTGPEIKLIATDVDGTLLSSKHELKPCTEAAVQAARALGVPVVVATGKTKGPWARDIVPRVATEGMPQLYLQGLVAYNHDGTLRFETVMDDSLVRATLDFADSNKELVVMFYCGDRILCNEVNEQTDRLAPYGEPTPEEVGDLRQVVGSVRVHKIIFLASEEACKEVRPSAEALLGPVGDLITALPGMLEVLPRGGGKEGALERVLKELEIGPENVLALGDGENDAGMLALAGVGVAMGNCGEHARDSADWVTRSNDEGGWAEAIDHFVLKPRATAPAAPPQVFVYGSLMPPEVLEALLGRIPPAAPAVLRGYHRFRVAGEPYPGAVRSIDSGPSIEGRVFWDLSDLEMQIFDAFEGDAYEKVEVEVEVAGGAAAGVQIYAYPEMEPPGHPPLVAEPWDYEAFRRVHMGQYVDMCREWAAEMAARGAW